MNSMIREFWMDFLIFGRLLFRRYVNQPTFLDQRLRSPVLTSMKFCKSILGWPCNVFWGAIFYVDYAIAAEKSEILGWLAQGEDLDPSPL